MAVDGQELPHLYTYPHTQSRPESGKLLIKGHGLEYP